jgi:HD-like signal output (HDOD) protein
MAVNHELRALDISIPAKPDVLVQVSLLLAEENVNLDALGHLIEQDMSLSAAMLKAVNSSLYGLKGRVQSAQQAITYLGTREVVGIAYEIGLRAAFGAAAELEPLWQRSAWRGLAMGRLAGKLGIDAWAAHSAGLFEECGKAVLFRHSVDHYRAMLRAATSDVELVSLEKVGFGVSHDALGAALCESWGLAAAAVTSVRHHVGVQATHTLPPDVSRRTICVLSGIAHAMADDPESMDEVARALAHQADLDETLVMRAARQVSEQLVEQERYARAA